MDNISNKLYSRLTIPKEDINADEWKYDDYGIEYNDNDEEIICFTFTHKREDKELYITYNPDIEITRDTFEKGIIQINTSDFRYIIKNRCTNKDKEEIYKLLDITKAKREE